MEPFLLLQSIRYPALYCYQEISLRCNLHERDYVDIESHEVENEFRNLGCNYIPLGLGGTSEYAVNRYLALPQFQFALRDFAA